MPTRFYRFIQFIGFIGYPLTRLEKIKCLMKLLFGNGIVSVETAGFALTGRGVSVDISLLPPSFK